MTKRYINVAYKDRDMAKRLGARWDASVRRWYCPPGSALAKVYSWRKPSSVIAKGDLELGAPEPQADINVPPKFQTRPPQTVQLSFLG